MMIPPPKRLIETSKIIKPWVEGVVFDPDHRFIFKKNTPQYVLDAYEEHNRINEEYQKEVNPYGC